jgi:hypothetical protein
MEFGPVVSLGPRGARRHGSLGGREGAASKCFLDDLMPVCLSAKAFQSFDDEGRE